MVGEVQGDRHGQLACRAGQGDARFDVGLPDGSADTQRLDRDQRMVCGIELVFAEQVLACVLDGRVRHVGVEAFVFAPTGMVNLEVDHRDFELQSGVVKLVGQDDLARYDRPSDHVRMPQSCQPAGRVDHEARFGLTVEHHVAPPLGQLGPFLAGRARCGICRIRYPGNGLAADQHGQRQQHQ